MVRNPPAKAGDDVSIARSGRSPGGGHGNTPVLQYFLPRKSYGQRSLRGLQLGES